MCILLIIDIIWTRSTNTLQVGCQHDPGGTRAQSNSIWSDPGPEAVGEDQSGSLLEEPQAPVVCSIYTTAGESDSVIVVTPPKKWLVDVVVVVLITPPPPLRGL